MIDIDRFVTRKTRTGISRDGERIVTHTYTTVHWRAYHLACDVRDAWRRFRAWLSHWI